MTPPSSCGRSATQTLHRLGGLFLFLVAIASASDAVRAEPAVPTSTRVAPLPPAREARIVAAVAAIDAALERAWRDAGVTPAVPEDSPVNGTSSTVFRPMSDS